MEVIQAFDQTEMFYMVPKRTQESLRTHLKSDHTDHILRWKSGHILFQWECKCFHWETTSAGVLRYTSEKPHWGLHAVVNCNVMCVFQAVLSGQKADVCEHAISSRHWGICMKTLQWAVPNLSLMRNSKLFGSLLKVIVHPGDTWAACLTFRTSCPPTFSSCLNTHERRQQT